MLEERFDDIVAEFMSLEYSELDSRRDELLPTLANDWQAIRERLPA